MSWSVRAIGKPAKVAERLQTEFEKTTYLVEPEREIARNIGVAVIKAVQDSVGGTGIVKVECSGSMVSTHSNHVHNISVTVTPIYGFVE